MIEHVRKSVVLLLLLHICLHCATEDSGSSSKQYCTSEAFQASCGDNEVLLIQNALYGRMRPGRCITAGYTHAMGCYADVTAFLDGQCSGRQVCKVMVGTMDAVAQPCPKDFKSYMEASYTCVPVRFGGTCVGSNYSVVKASSGYLAPYSTSPRQGPASCPWLLQAKEGQKINISAVNLAGTHRHRGGGSEENPSSTMMTCPFLVHIKEKGLGEKSIDLCSSRQREHTIYTSRSHEVQVSVQVHAPRQPELMPVLLHYQVFGCPDIIPPLGAHVVRTNDVASVVCNDTQETWYVTCKDQTWIGEPGNCTHMLKDADSLYGRDKKSTPTFHHGIVLAVLIGIALGTFIGGFMLCVVFFIRKRRSPLRRPPQFQPHPGDHQCSGEDEDLYDCRGHHTGNYLCQQQEKLCGGDVSEYTHVWNVHPHNQLHHMASENQQNQNQSTFGNTQQHQQQTFGGSNQMNNTLGGTGSRVLVGPNNTLLLNNSQASTLLHNKDKLQAQQKQQQQVYRELDALTTTTENSSKLHC